MSDENLYVTPEKHPFIDEDLYVIPDKRSLTYDEKISLANLSRKLGIWRSLYSPVKLLCSGGIVGKQTSIAIQTLYKPVDVFSPTVLFTPAYAASTLGGVFTGTMAFFILTATIIACENYLTQKALKNIIIDWRDINAEELKTFTVRNRKQIFSFATRLALSSLLISPVYITGMIYANMLTHLPKNNFGIMSATAATDAVLMTGLGLLVKVFAWLFDLPISPLRLLQLFLLFSGMLLGENICNNINTRSMSMTGRLEFGGLVPVGIACVTSMLLPLGLLILHLKQNRQEAHELAERDPLLQLRPQQ